jgi:peroxiredoxin
MRLHVGDVAPTFRVPDLNGQLLNLDAYRGASLLLSFVRSAACPLCNLRMWYLTQQYPQWAAQGLQVIAVFETSIATTRKYVGADPLPFPMVADGNTGLFQAYGVEANPSGLVLGIVKRLGDYWKVWREFAQVNMSDGNPAQLPADFLLNPDLTIHTAYYGQDIGDHLPLAQIDAFVQDHQLVPVG